MTRLGLPGTEDRTSPAPDVWTGTPGKARPSSSAVRRAPTTLDRTVRPPQLPHSKSLATAPHQRQVGIASPAFNDNGPWQRAQRAGSLCTLPRAVVVERRRCDADLSLVWGGCQGLRVRQLRWPDGAV